MKIRHLTYFIMLNFINQRAYFQRISYNFNEVLIGKVFFYSLIKVNNEIYYIILLM